jgi:hypothetical protein
MHLFDWYSAGFSLIIVSLLEVIAIAWIYGLKKFAYDIELMLGFRPNMYWIANWTFITPALLAVSITIACWVSNKLKQIPIAPLSLMLCLCRLCSLHLTLCCHFMFIVTNRMLSLCRLCSS